jgi:Methylase involved in ubiquinone/menaquinone biosynthesis
MFISPHKYKTISKKNFNNKAATYFDTWDGKYSLLMYTDVIKKINARSYNSILDIGCGPGVMLARILNHREEAYACGLDFSSKMIDQATILLNKRAELVIGDAENLPWKDETFDVLVCNSSFHHYPEPYKVLKEMKRVLKYNGRLILADPWWNGFLRFFINLYLKTPFNVEGDFKIYSQKEIIEICTLCGFKVIDFDNPIGKYYIITATIAN